ncbi:MAG: zinc ribbon domain-containing protein [Magnetococcales bacterium]|nr:zinc ribbon domain-containing protein [Magnetococcales bacterium]
MPLYDYKCNACGGRFELNHAMSAPVVTKCPGCGQEKLRKVLSTGGVMGSSKLGQADSGPPMPSCGGGGCGSGMCGLG